MTVIAGMDDTVSDDNLNEEIMRCFSNAPTMIQAIGVLRGIRHWQNEQACLYAARYEFVHNREHNIQPEEQTQVSGIIHYVSTLITHLKKKLLKKLNTYHRPKSLREAMDVTMDFEVEHQITQPESELTVMETCYKEPTLEEIYITEESPANIIKEVNLHPRRISIQDRRTSREIRISISQVMDQVTSLSTTKGTTRLW